LRGKALEILFSTELPLKNQDNGPFPSKSVPRPFSHAGPSNFGIGRLRLSAQQMAGQCNAFIFLKVNVEKNERRVAEPFGTQGKFYDL
jgi:hypothetical protein